MKKLPKADISAYRLAMFERCPKEAQFYARGERRAEPDAAHMGKGKVLHRAIEDVARSREVCPGPDRPTADELLAAVDRGAVRAGLAPADHDDVRAGAIESLQAINLSGRLVAPEKRCVLPLADGLHYEVRFDFVARDRDVVIARDWKTGAGEPPADDEVSATPQVGLYLMALHQLWPDARGWEVHMIYTRHNKLIRVPWTERLDALWRARAVHAVREREAGVKLARIGAHCGSCSYRYVCQSWLSVLALKNGREGPLAEFGDDELLEARAEASRAEKISSARRKDLDKELKKRLRAVSGKRLTGKRYEATLSQRETNRVAIEALLELAEMRDVDVVGLLAQACRVSSTKAMKLPKDDGERKVVERWRTKRRSWTLRVRERKA